jgi:hypothetical protein
MKRTGKRLALNKDTLRRVVGSTFIGSGNCQPDGTKYCTAGTNCCPTDPTVLTNCCSLDCPNENTRTCSICPGDCM